MKNFIKNKLIVYGLFIVILSIICLVYSILLYFKKFDFIINNNHLITLLIGIISFIFLGLLSGIAASKNGLLEGFISGLIIILLTLIINIFLKNPFELKTLLKIFIYLISSSLGGIIGVNIRFNKKS